MAKQPYFHRAVVLFTATKPINRWDFNLILKQIKHKNIVEGSVECDEIDDEPGDPAKL